MRTEEVIIGGCAAIGVLIYFFAFLLPMKRASAAAGRPWRMYPVCFLGDYCDRVIARKEAEKQRLIDLTRTRQAPPDRRHGSPPFTAAHPPARPLLRQPISAH